MTQPVSSKLISQSDMRLIEEAVRRLDRSRAAGRFDHEAMVATLAVEVARGRRDLFSLVRAGQQCLDGR